MSTPSFHDLSPETTAQLSRHNLLKAWVRAEVTAAVVQSIDLTHKECEDLWHSYLQKKNIGNDLALSEHLQQMGLSVEDLHWQLNCQRGSATAKSISVTRPRHAS